MRSQSVSILAVPSLVELCEQNLNFAENNLSSDWIKRCLILDGNFVLSKLCLATSQSKEQVLSCIKIILDKSLSERFNRTFFSAIVHLFPMDRFFDRDAHLNLSNFLADQRKICLLAHHIDLYLETKGSVDGLADYLQQVNVYKQIPAEFHESIQGIVNTVLDGGSLPDLCKCKLNTAFVRKIHSLQSAAKGIKDPAQIFKELYPTGKCTSEKKRNISESSMALFSSSLELHLRAAERYKTPEVFLNHVQAVVRTVEPMFYRTVEYCFIDDRTIKGRLVNLTKFITLFEKYINIFGLKTKIYYRADLDSRTGTGCMHCYILVRDPLSDEAIIIDPNYRLFLPSNLKKPKAQILVMDIKSRDEFAQKWINESNPLWQNNLGKLWGSEGYDEVRLNLASELLFCTEFERQHSIQKKLDDFWNLIGIRKEIKSPETPAKAKRYLLEYSERQAPNLSVEDELSLLDDLQTIPGGGRSSFGELLNLDPRAMRFCKMEAVGYFMSIREQVHPHAVSDEYKAIYGASGSDLFFPMLALNPTHLYMIDEKPLNATVLQSYIQAGGIQLNHFLLLNEYGRQKKDSSGIKTDTLVKNFELCVFFELFNWGIDLKKIEISDVVDSGSNPEGVRIRFPWSYHGQRERMYEVIYIRADITKPETYPESLKRILDNGIDCYFQKASFKVPCYYGQFLPTISAAISNNGCLLLNDMDYLGNVHDSFSHLSTSEAVYHTDTGGPKVKAYADLLKVPFFDMQSEIKTVSLIHNNYWLMVNLIRKTVR